MELLQKLNVEDRSSGLALQGIPSWNQIIDWLKEVERLGGFAHP